MPVIKGSLKTPFARFQAAFCLPVFRLLFVCPIWMRVNKQSTLRQAHRHHPVFRLPVHSAQGILKIMPIQPARKTLRYCKNRLIFRVNKTRNITRRPSHDEKSPYIKPARHRVKRVPKRIQQRPHAIEQRFRRRF